jgi:aspartate racemase
MFQQTPRKRLAIVGGLGALAGADVYTKLMRTLSMASRPEHYDIVFEQRRFDSGDVQAMRHEQMNRRMLYVYELVHQFESRQVDRVLLPCFISHTFIDELQAELALPIVNIMDALLAHLQRNFPAPCRIGVLTTSYVRQKGLFERYLAGAGHTLLYPGAERQQDCVMRSIYGADGIQAGHAHGPALALLKQACDDLLEQGAQLIVAGATEIAIVAEALRAMGVPILDSNQVYVDYALAEQGAPAAVFKVGIVGGIGPAATVDFMNKIISNTTAGCDQEHVRLLVEHNPAIPDRTAHLIGDGSDPTVALYAACKRLEAGDAALIAIPCNTAHAFVERIQPYLSIPIVNMLTETVAYLCAHHARGLKVGLLATSGTVASKVYADAFAGSGFDLIVPDAEHQQLVMRAIYGERGIKAGHLSGQCRTDLLEALAHLVGQGARAIVLGCTELPLLLARQDDFAAAGQRVALLDPTEILARRCVSLAQEHRT